MHRTSKYNRSCDNSSYFFILPLLFIFFIIFASRSSFPFFFLFLFIFPIMWHSSSQSKRKRYYNSNNIDTTLEVNPNESATIRYEKKPQFCYNCGNQFTSSDRFCVNCGFKLDKM